MRSAAKENIKKKSSKKTIVCGNRFQAWVLFITNHLAKNMKLVVPQEIINTALIVANN